MSQWHSSINHTNRLGQLRWKLQGGGTEKKNKRAWGTCNTDGIRYPERLQNGVYFIPFLKPQRDKRKCVMWIRLCIWEYQLNLIPQVGNHCLNRPPYEWLPNSILVVPLHFVFVIHVLQCFRQPRFRNTLITSLAWAPDESVMPCFICSCFIFLVRLPPPILFRQISSRPGLGWP